MLACALPAACAGADDPPNKLTAEERKELGVKWNELNTAGVKAHQARKYPEATKSFQDALEVARRIYNQADFPDGHPDLARSLSNLAALYQAQGKYAAAEPLFTDALEMRKRLFKGQDHLDLARSLSNLAGLYLAQAKYAAAEPLYTDALEMRKRLFKGQDHPDLALSLNNLAVLYKAQAKYAAAQPLYTDALEMRKRLFKGQDHPDLAGSLNNLAYLYEAQGQYAAAEPLLKDTLEMYRRLFKGQDHPALAVSLNNLAALYQAQARYAAAEPLLKDALEMRKRLMIAYAQQKSEGEALTFTSAQSLTRDGFLSVARLRAATAANYDPGTVYHAIWGTKGMVARVYEQRQLQARAAGTDPTLAKMLNELADARRRRAELLLAPDTKDPGTLKKREEYLAALDRTITKLNETLPKLLPAVARIDKLDAATVTDLQKALPADAALVDYIQYTFFEWDDTKSPGQKEKRTKRYLAFVVTRDKVAWVDLDTAANIEPAASAWREAITGGKEIPPAIPAKVRELVWEKVRKELPAGIKTVYVCPDADLCRVPWGALPGDKPNTILLEDFAVATIPHTPYLLDKFWPQDPVKNPPTGALVVGGVKYDAELASPAPNPAASHSGEPLLKPGAKLGWSFLPGTAAEATGVFGAATAKKLPVTALKDEQATASAILAALPKAKYAHLATHGFFADPSFRSIFQLDEKDYEMSRRGERIGRAANSPLVMTGLVFAGANNPKTPGRGIVTGESLIDLDLSGLELAVLSACETGLGDVAGGEGTFGLQRAFHLAGTRDVVASLWKVPDQSTAALMALFYRNLWEKNLTPMEALRQAQLTIYRDPSKIPELAKGFRGKFEEVTGTGGDPEIKPEKDGKAHPLLWAAFTLSGPGR